MAQVNPFQPTSAWQRIFLLSKVNGAPYEEQQVSFKWPWPKHTYLQRRLEYLRTDRTQSFGQRGPAAKKELAATDLAGWISVLRTDAPLATDETTANSTYVNIPSDTWYWCANPMRKRL